MAGLAESRRGAGVAMVGMRQARSGTSAFSSPGIATSSSYCIIHSISTICSFHTPQRCWSSPAHQEDLFLSFLSMSLILINVPIGRLQPEEEHNRDCDNLTGISDEASSLHNEHISTDLSKLCAC
jgi:hypothetical protein